MTTTDDTKKPRGFASWDPEKLRQTAQAGGRSAHASKKAHQFSREEARVNGRLGGLASHAKRREREAAKEQP